MKNVDVHVSFLCTFYFWSSSFIDVRDNPPLYSHNASGVFFVYFMSMSFYVMVKLMPNSKVRWRLLRDEALKCGHSVARETKATCPTTPTKFTMHC